MHDIETLIDHFLGVSWGPVIPPGEACVAHRGDQGQQQLLPDQRRRTPSRTARASARRPSRTSRWCPLMSRGLMIPDLIAILGSIDFVLADVDR